MTGETPQLSVVQRLRKSPFYDATVRWGVRTFTVYNHMLMPTCFESTEADYWKLVTGTTLWDVAAERQVEIIGKDAFRLVRLLTPCNLSEIAVGQCKYAPVVDHNGGMINDPLITRLDDDRFWISLADSDVLLWAKGVALGMRLDVEIFEPDVSPLALQGPQSRAVASSLFGDWIGTLGFFRVRETELDGIPLVVARSGWSKQGGFEFYLLDGRRGEELWERVMHAGKPFGIAPAAPSTIERVESGLLSYGSDMTLDNNPLEIGLQKLCDLDQEFDFIGKSALREIRRAGVRQKLVGLTMGEQRLPGNQHWWPVLDTGDAVLGKVTSAVYSPRLQRYIGFAIIETGHAVPGKTVRVVSPHGEFPGLVGPASFETPPAHARRGSEKIS
ncbi:MAG: dimethylsulfoniopropionate demethylase [Gammaproteobacteria bacterium]|nr:dimethylsulfoniopropionate demethylase [Gammaproteobacteria bacterium]